MQGIENGHAFGVQPDHLGVDDGGALGHTNFSNKFQQPPGTGNWVCDLSVKGQDLCVKGHIGVRCSMSSNSAKVPLSQIFRDRAAECRTMAELFRSEKTREHLLNVAADYESMATKRQRLNLKTHTTPREPVISILARA